MKSSLKQTTGKTLNKNCKKNWDKIRDAEVFNSYSKKLWGTTVVAAERIRISEPSSWKSGNSTGMSQRCQEGDWYLRIQTSWRVQKSQKSSRLSDWMLKLLLESQHWQAIVPNLCFSHFSSYSWSSQVRSNCAPFRKLIAQLRGGKIREAFFSIPKTTLPNGSWHGKLNFWNLNRLMISIGSDFQVLMFIFFLFVFFRTLGFSCFLEMADGFSLCVLGHLRGCFQKELTRNMAELFV